jgi:hypothetical protein
VNPRKHRDLAVDGAVAPPAAVDGRDLELESVGVRGVPYAFTVCLVCLIYTCTAGTAVYMKQVSHMQDGSCCMGIVSLQMVYLDAYGPIHSSMYRS